MSDTIKTKQCWKCKQIKSVSEFYKNRYAKDGYQKQCISCCKQTNRTKKSREYRRLYMCKYRKTHKQATRNYDARRKETEPEKLKAKDYINNRIKAGSIIKVSQFYCVLCGNRANHYHHYNGYKPENWLDIIPVCHVCHKSIHLTSA